MQEHDREESPFGPDKPLKVPKEIELTPDEARKAKKDLADFLNTRGGKGETKVLGPRK